MKKSKNLKIVLIGILLIALLGISTSVFADDNTGFTDLSNTLNTTNNTTNSTTNNTTNSTTNNTTTNNTTNTTNTNTNLTNTNTNVNKTNNTALTNANNTTNLPKTGLQDSLPIVVLIAVLAISGVYAFKKIKEYQNV